MKAARIALRISFGLLIIAALINRFETAAVLSAFRSANSSVLALTFILYPLTLIILTVRWRTILSRMGCPIPMAVAYQAFVAGVMLSDLTPAKAGELSRPLLIREWVDLGKGMASVALDKLTDLVTIFILSISGIIILSWRSSWQMILAAGSLLAVLVLIMMVWLHRPILTKLINLIGWSRLEELVRSIDVTLSATENVKKQMALYILLTIGAWTTQALRTVIVAKAFGYDVPIHVLLFVLPLMSVLSIIPITISGLGLIEGGVTAMLVELGVPGATGFAVALADRFITVLVHILIGARYSTKIM